MDKKKSSQDTDYSADLEKLPDSKPDGNTVRTIHPLGMRVVVRVPPAADTTDGGLYLPESAKAKVTSESLLVEVLEVASAIDDDTDEETNISGIPHGAKILIPRNAGTRIPWDETLRIVESKDVLALVDELNVT